MQCYTTQRDPTVYACPDDFIPERWLESDKVSNEMKAMFMPFSAGSRACLGINLAWMELKVITATLVREHSVQLGPSTTENNMKMIDHFLAAPKAGKCDLIFTPVK